MAFLHTGSNPVLTTKKESMEFAIEILRNERKLLVETYKVVESEILKEQLEKMIKELYEAIVILRECS